MNTKPGSRKNQGIVQKQGLNLLEPNHKSKQSTAQGNSRAIHGPILYLRGFRAYQDPPESHANPKKELQRRVEVDIVMDLGFRV